MANFLGKKYKQVSSENLDEYFKKVGMNYMIRKLVTLERPTTCLTEKDGIYNLNLVYMVMNINYEFKLDEEKEHKYPDGSLRKVIFTLQDNILTQHQLGENETFTTYTFTDTDLKIEIKLGDIVSSRTCKLIE